MDGSKRQSFPTAEGWGMGQGDTRGVRQSYHEQAVLYVCHGTGDQLRKLQQDLLTLKMGGQNYRIYIQLSAALYSVGTLVYAHKCLSLKSSTSLH